MKKIIIYIVVGLLVLVLGVVIISHLSNPLRKSDEQIRSSILKLTPTGMSKEDVIKVIEDNEQWYKNYRYYNEGEKYQQFDYGFIIKDGRAGIRYHGYKYDDSEMIGKETIKATVGQYRNFFNVAVFAYWAFDEDGKLVDVGINKEADTF